MDAKDTEVNQTRAELQRQHTAMQKDFESKAKQMHDTMSAEFEQKKVQLETAAAQAQQAVRQEVHKAVVRVERSKKELQIAQRDIA